MGGGGVAGPLLLSMSLGHYEPEGLSYTSGRGRGGRVVRGRGPGGRGIPVAATGGRNALNQMHRASKPNPCTHSRSLALPMRWQVVTDRPDDQAEVSRTVDEEVPEAGDGSPTNEQALATGVARPSQSRGFGRQRVYQDPWDDAPPEVKRLAMRPGTHMLKPGPGWPKGGTLLSC